MKLFRRTIFLCLIGIVFNSCSKTDTKRFEGNYTYNTSGEVVMTTDGRSVSVPLMNSTGQMQIIDLDEDGRVMVIKRTLSGKVMQGYGTIVDNQIEFEPQTFTTFIASSDISGTAQITSTATGTLYNQNTLIINEVYNGTFVDSIGTLNNSVTLYGNDILTVAERNK